MKKKIQIAALLLLCSACGTTKYIPLETVKTEFRDKIVRDSIFQYDSVFVKDRGDTVFFERYRYLFRDKTVRDSIFRTDTIRVPFPVEVVKKVKEQLSGWQNFQLWCGRIAIVTVSVVACLFRVQNEKQIAVIIFSILK